MKLLYIIPLAIICFLLGACGKEAPFDKGGEKGEGQLLKSALAADVTDEDLIRTRNNSLMKDFILIFTKKGETQPTVKYKYSEMPDVVSLPAGIYTCTAIFGELYPAAWESPYFTGESGEFEIKANEITSYIDPIVCRLQNIKVTVSFDASLANRMSEDSYVDVKVGSTDALRFSIAEVEAGKAGYFMYSNECTLVATFSGKVDGNLTSETKSYKDISSGYWYKLNFRPHPGSDPNQGGNIESDLKVEATVQIIDINRDIPEIEDDILDDDERPKEDDDDPDPGIPAPPQITADYPINLDKDNIVTDGMNIVLHVKSTAEGGFTKFTCDIVSNELTPEALAGVGLTDHLDLVELNPDDPDADAATREMAAALAGLGFPVNVGGQKSAELNLTKFVPMMKSLEAGTHKFVLKVGDANGETEKTLILVFK